MLDRSLLFPVLLFFSSLSLFQLFLSFSHITLFSVFCTLYVRTPALLLTAPPHTPITLPSPSSPSADRLSRQQSDRQTQTHLHADRLRKKVCVLCQNHLLLCFFHSLTFNISQTPTASNRSHDGFSDGSPINTHLQVRGNYTLRYGYSFALSFMSMTVAFSMEMAWLVLSA